MDVTAAQELAQTGLDAEHWRGLQRGEYLLPQCPECSTWTWPAEPRCRVCGHFGAAWVETTLTGTVYSWTKTWYPFVAERAGELPYVTVLVELPGAGNARVLGIFDGDESKLRLGAPLGGRIVPPSSSTFGLHSVTWS
jgi:uncharacterized OB-fold protein